MLYILWFEIGLLIGVILMLEMVVSRMITYFLNQGNTFDKAYQKVRNILKLKYKNYSIERTDFYKKFKEEK